MLNGTAKYPPYKQLQSVESFLRSGSVIVGGAEVKRRTLDVMESEGFPVGENMVEEFITLSFQDAIQCMVKHGDSTSTTAIALLEKIHERNWTGTTTWVTDYVELLLGKAIENNPYGIWDVFFRNGDLYIINQGDYAHMVYEYMKKQDKLPDLCEVLSHGLFPEERAHTCQQE